ncbi:MAG: DEAD/DEAH box helicase [Christensenellaceae bacterium]|jgi:transcription-repair coupling factor (superfamily II helicase)|nr:DEAD/DEAH box helicase [Christensenellaceae bacterium]
MKQIAELLKPYLSQNITNNDGTSSALFATLIEPPFAFVTTGIESVQIAKTIFEQAGKKVQIFDGTTNFHGEVLVLDDVLIAAPVNETKVEKFTFTVGQKFTINKIKDIFEWFNYEYAIKGDIIDIYGLDSGDITRIMFDGDIIENIKIIDAHTLSAKQKLNEIKIEKTVQTENTITIPNAVRPFYKTVILDNARSMLDWTGFTVYRFRSIDQTATPFPTAILPNYYSAMSILTADITNAVQSQGKTAVLFVGGSHTAENYLRDKGVDFVVAKKVSNGNHNNDVDYGATNNGNNANPNGVDFAVARNNKNNGIAPNKINIVYDTFPASIELKKLNLLIYSLNKTELQPQSQQTDNLLTHTNAKFIMPAVGDCVVHSFHGIGRYIGTKRLTFQNREDDYLVLQYDGGAVVYVPTAQTEMLSNYVGEPSRLNRIGGQDFANAKQRVRRHLKELSFKLSELYTKRAKAKANIYEIEPQANKAFADTFRYPLTPDQEKTIKEINRDLQGNKIMDRLVCGDVGYGKTEIAFRTAFVAIMNGYQVALLCPTTILSVQHYNLAVARFSPFGIKVAVLNRFATTKETNEIVTKLQNGEIDFLIGTHKLLSLDKSDFAHLGLLVLDEEQRFGVEAKEKIKKLTNNVDVLTMSATPIPRTLNLSLMGLRDISVITTPPKDRLGVVTYVCEFSWELLLDAIAREKARNGQTIVLYNNVQNIKHFTEKLRAKTDKDTRVNYVHGQMGTTQIEDAITKIYEQETDVIVASTIIENGIDIATANTLFVVNADRLGVAQMHQLRGRVGRGITQAYAYFTYEKKELVSTTAQSRIEAIKNFYGSGAGFNIAMRDLELRGGGEVLGANQSGHIEEIGMEAFAQILNEIAEENRQKEL